MVAQNAPDPILSASSPHVLTPEFAKMLEENGYTHVRVLDDGSVAALLRLMFTTSICVDINWDSWASRYCFKDPAMALEQLNLMKSPDDVPTGFIARRGYEPENDSSSIFSRK